MTNALDNSRPRGHFKTATALMWLALPASVVLYALVWSQLPARLATHFDFANHPNGWMSREGSLIFSLVSATLMAGTATWVLSRVTKPDPSAWGLLILFYVILGTLLWAEYSVIAFNVRGRPVNVTPVFTVGIVAGALLVVVAVTTRRGTELPARALLADETHASALWAGVLGAPALVFIGLAVEIPFPGARVAIGLAAAMMMAAAVMAWSGFHYLFSPAGVEIRTLGFRLRSISATDIQTYVVDRWTFAGGYGIRGVGDRRAYVWGNNGVRIKTTQGEVFLGHSDPDKIVRDLDLITRNHEARADSRVFPS
jgi:uncharacterized protein DUF1648